jgi:HTH-like domain
LRRHWFEPNGEGGRQRFFGKKAQALDREVRRGMIERTHPKLSVGAQCQLLSISRLSFYYAPQGETAMNLELMLKVDKQFLETPFYGVRQMTWHLQNEGHAVNEKRIRRLMRLMRLMPIYQKPDTSRPAKGHKTYPYLLGGLRIDRPNQVWCADITYLPPLGRFALQIACRAMDAQGLSLPCRHHGLVHPQGAGLAHLQHAGGRVLS